MSAQIAVLMACYNRREKTLACLAKLQAVVLAANVEVVVWLVDDGSTDGTADAVKAQFPQVKVIRSEGGLFWARSMHLAWQGALDSRAELFLWLNDDVNLEPDALVRLLHELDAQSPLGQPMIVVGSTADPSTRIATYGGMKRISRWRLTKAQIVTPGREAVRCDTMNGNCVLVPRSVVQQIGIIDAVFDHAMADLDYGFRATKAGIPIWVVPGFVGECRRNEVAGSFLDPHHSLWGRMKDITSRKGLPPKSWLVLAYRHGGALWPAIFVWPYLRTILSATFEAAARWRLP